MSLARNPLVLLLLFGFLVIATRVPYAPGQFFTFDDVNLAYSIGHYDIRMSQPQPPGYPLFVLQMRILRMLRFRRAESILLALAIAGSILALLLTVHCGNRFFGGDSGFWAAAVLLLYPPFWHAGITSALRVQLAVVSLAVAACCWKAWGGEGRWVRYSAVALAIGAGIRPETGVLLFPLWAAGAWLAAIDWKERLRALGWMTATVALWLLPAMFASGGPVSFIRANLDYIADQASVSSGLFGAADSIWMRTVYRLLVWVFCGLIGLVLPAVLAWRGREAWAIGRRRLAFLGVWFVPAFLFAINVHVEDPGQTLAMVPVVALLGGYWVERALENTSMRTSRLIVAIAIAATFVLCQVWEYPNDIWRIQWLAVTALGVGLAMKLAPSKNLGYLPRWQVIPVLLAPLLYTNYTYFQHRGWYYQGTAASGWAARAEHAWADINSGFALTSLEQIQTTLAIDDHTLRETRRLVGERPGKTVVVWERGLTAWRKAAYYSPDTDIFVLEHKKIRSGSPPVIVTWNGAHLVRREQGAAPLRLNLAAGTRIVWQLNPRTDFFEAVRSNFPLMEAGPVYYCDLPAESGSRMVGEYEVAW